MKKIMKVAARRNHKIWHDAQFSALVCRGRHQHQQATGRQHDAKIVGISTGQLQPAACSGPRFNYSEGLITNLEIENVYSQFQISNIRHFKCSPDLNMLWLLVVVRPS